MDDAVWSSACPVARTLDVVGDRWSLLIVRDAFDGIRRFSDFQRSLGVAKNILSDRLRTLVERGVLRTQPASDGSNYREYVLTEKGQDLFDLLVSLRQWGQAHAYQPGEAFAYLVDAHTDERLPKLAYATPQGRPIHSRDVRVRMPSDQS